MRGERSSLNRPDVPPFTYDPAKYVSGAPVFAATDETYDEVDVKVIGFQWAMPFAGSKMSIMVPTAIVTTPLFAGRRHRVKTVLYVAEFDKKILRPPP